MPSSRPIPAQPPQSARRKPARANHSLRFGWAILGSTWLHVMAGGAIALMPRCQAEPKVEATEALTLVTLAPLSDTTVSDKVGADATAPAALAAQPGEDEADSTAVPVSTPPPSPGTAAMAAPRQGDPETVEPSSDPAELPQSPDRTPPGQLKPSQGSPDEDPRAETADFDPLDAVADLAIDAMVDPTTLVVQPEPPPSEPAPESPMEEEPEEEKVPEQNPEWQTYLNVEDQDAIEEDNVDSAYIGGRNARAEELRQAHVTSEQYGAPTPPLEAVPIDQGRQAIEQADGTPDGSLGDAPASGSPVTNPAPPKLGGGMSGRAPGKGSPESGRDQRGGELARSGRRAQASKSGVAAAASSQGRAGTKEAPNPDNEMALRRATWWSPTVARVVRPTPDASPAVAPVTAPLPTEATARAPEPKPDRSVDRGGTEQEVDVDEPTPEADEQVVDADSGEADPIEEPREETPPVESVADLREAMGWGGTSRQRMSPRRSTPGVAASDASRQTSQQTVAEDLLVERFAIVDARATPRGRYRALLDKEISEIWNTQDLPLHERALGIQGDVTVLFRVKSNGKVLDKTLLRSSGYLSLDTMALEAVPKRLPRIPRDIDADTIAQKYTFHYRNPMIIGGGRTP